MGGVASSHITAFGRQSDADAHCPAVGDTYSYFISLLRSLRYDGLVLGYLSSDLSGQTMLQWHL